MAKKIFAWILLASISLVYVVLFVIHKPQKQFHFEGILLNESAPFLFNKSLVEPNDYNRLIGIAFNFIILNEPCKQSAPFLLIVIHSSADNFIKRITIRETWGLNDDQIKTLFLIGNSTSTEVNRKVEVENRHFKDIVQGSFVENYYNLTYKHGMALKYTLYHCPQAKYVLRADDDIFVNTPELVAFFKNKLSVYGVRKCIMCNVIRNAKVFRSYRSKWRMSFEIYPGKYYPTYCEGWHVVYSPDVMFQLYRELQKHKYFNIDDVLVTGILAKNINYVNHTDTATLTYLSHVQMWMPKWFLFGGIEFDEDTRRMLWNKFSRIGITRRGNS